MIFFPFTGMQIMLHGSILFFSSPSLHSRVSSVSPSPCVSQHLEPHSVIFILFSKSSLTSPFAVCAPHTGLLSSPFLAPTRPIIINYVRGKLSKGVLLSIASDFPL